MSMEIQTKITLEEIREKYMNMLADRIERELKLLGYKDLKRAKGGLWFDDAIVIREKSGELEVKIYYPTLSKDPHRAIEILTSWLQSSNEIYADLIKTYAKLREKYSIKAELTLYSVTIKEGEFKNLRDLSNVVRAFLKHGVTVYLEWITVEA